MADDHTRAVTLMAAIVLQQHALLSHLSTVAESEDMDLTDKEETEEHNEEMDTAAQIMHLGNLISITAVGSPSSGSTSRGPYNQYEKCVQFFGISMGWPDRQFRHEYRSVAISSTVFPTQITVLRMSRTTFDRLVSLLEEDSIFVSRGPRPQRAVRYQLAAFLLRYGREGSDAIGVANKLGIGEGTVFIYCQRVTRALRKIGLTVISWGNLDHRHETAEFIENHSGFRNCIGIVDGSLIRLSEVPAEHGQSYWCRKKYPAVRVSHTITTMPP